jgi:hypothetical protein
LGLFFVRKEANIQKKIVLKFQRNQSYGSLDIKETVKGQKISSGNKRETERERSNLGGAPTPPPPWQPWTRGKTLLPFRGRPTRKNKEGYLSPSLPVHRSAAGGNIVTAIYTNNFAAVNTNSFPLYAAV